MSSKKNFKKTQNFSKNSSRVNSRPKAKKSGKNSNKVSPWKKPNELPQDAALCNPEYAMKFIKSVHFQTDCYTTVLNYELSTTASGTGVDAPVFGNSPSNAAGFSSLAACFDEYRTLAMMLSFRPQIYVGGTTSLQFGPYATCIDYDTSAALTSYSGASLYSSFQEFKGQSNWKRLALMGGVENSIFTSTGGPITTFSIKVYSSGNTASILLGWYTMTYVVQFRGKGI